MQTAKFPKPWLVARGQTLSRHFEVLNSDETPFDFTGYLLAFQVRTNPRAETVLLTATVTGDNAGNLDIVIDAEDTAAIDAGNYYADLRMESAGGEVNYPFSCEFRITETVTR